MLVKKIVVGNLKENCYILEEKNYSIIIDPGDDYEKILNNIVKKPKFILITHSHFDHIGAVQNIKEKFGIKDYNYNNLKEGINEIEGVKFEVINTKGHTSDSVTYYFKEYSIMFTGDFLFKLSIGRTDMPTGNIYEMRKSIEKIKEYPTNITIYPGHGEETSLFYEINNNYFLK